MGIAICHWETGFLPVASGVFSVQTEEGCWSKIWPASAWDWQKRAHMYMYCNIHVWSCMHNTDRGGEDTRICRCSFWITFFWAFKQAALLIDYHWLSSQAFLALVVDVPLVFVLFTSSFVNHMALTSQHALTWTISEDSSQELDRSSGSQGAADLSHFRFNQMPLSFWMLEHKSKELFWSRHMKQEVVHISIIPLCCFWSCRFSCVYYWFPPCMALPYHIINIINTILTWTYTFLTSFMPIVKHQQSLWLSYCLYIMNYPIASKCHSPGRKHSGLKHGDDIPSATWTHPKLRSSAMQKTEFWGCWKSRISACPQLLGATDATEKW